MAKHNETGAWGEERAAQYLIEKGYRILSRNWRNRGGKELDIVALDGDTLVFVEVKTRAAHSLIDPLAAVTPLKQHRLVLAADSYIRCHRLNLNARFDIITIQGTDLQHIPNAFRPSATYY